MTEQDPVPGHVAPSIAPWLSVRDLADPFGHRWEVGKRIPDAQR